MFLCVGKDSRDFICVNVVRRALKKADTRAISYQERQTFLETKLCKQKGLVPKPDFFIFYSYLVMSFNKYKYT